MTNRKTLNDGLDQAIEKKEITPSAIGGIEFESEEERNRYIVSVFPDLVKAGKFVEAMELVHGNSSFNWLYGLFDKVQRRLFRREKDAVVTGKAARAPKASPRSGRENVVWFPPDLGREHQPGKHKDPVTA